MKRNSKISFAAFCRDILAEPISRAWDVVYRAFDGEPLREDELELFRTLSGRDDYAPNSVHELVAVKGRRAHGTKTACKYLCYKIHTSDFRSHATKSDRLHALVVLQTRDVAREVMAYFSSFYEQSDALRGEVAEILKNSIELKNRFIISIGTCSYRAPRGITAPLALLDEVGVYRVEGADVDREVVRSLTPAMVQFPNRKLILLGSPWIKAGVLFERFERRMESSDRLVVHCPTPLMNTMIPAEELAREEQADPQNYRREFLAEWLDDVDQFLPDSDIDLAIRSGGRELPFRTALAGRYSATIDASGLSGKDRFTFAIGHRAIRDNAGDTREGIALDVLRGWQRQAVGVVCDEIAVLLKAYGLRSVIADQFGFSFLRELLSQRGIETIQLPFTSRSKPEIFLDLKLALSQGRIRLLDHPESLRELRMLESKRTSGGNYSISAPRGQHDDYATVIALLAHRGKAENTECFAYLSTGGHGMDFSRGIARTFQVAKPAKPEVLPPDSPQFWRRRGSL